MASGFKDSTKTQYTSGGKCFAKGGVVKGPKGAAADSKGFAQLKRGPAPKAVKKAAGGRVNAPTIGALEQANRDTGGLDRKGEAAARSAVARGNRASAEEAGESALVRRAPRKGVPAYKDEPVIKRGCGGFAAKR